MVYTIAYRNVLVLWLSARGREIVSSVHDARFVVSPYLYHIIFEHFDTARRFTEHITYMWKNTRPVTPLCACELYNPKLLAMVRQFL